jgi:hypothetical protein
MSMDKPGGKGNGKELVSNKIMKVYSILKN